MAAGDAGNDFLRGILNFGDSDGGATGGQGGAPANMDEQVQQLDAGVNSLVEAANDGSWAISEEAGKAYITALENYLDAWWKNRRHFNFLAQQPELGSSPYADQVGRHINLVAEGDDQSARTQLDALQGIVERARDAIKTAMNKYDQADQENSIDLKTAGAE